MDAQLALVVIAQQGIHSASTALPHVIAAAVMEDKELLESLMSDCNAAIKAISRFKSEVRRELRARELQAVENEERFGKQSL